MRQDYDVIVIGAGHAGVEAALASAKLHKKTVLINLSLDRIATMPCNPSVGGPAKGIVVREIDALGGEMGKAADATALQTKLLNSSRGPGVWALRVQSDKEAYSQYMANALRKTENLTLKVGVVKTLLISDQRFLGVELLDGTKIFAPTGVLTTGTYLKSEILKGHERQDGAFDGQKTPFGISQSLQTAGLKLLRFKTGTPPRVYRDSVDLSGALAEPGTDLPLAFSFQTQKFTPVSEQELCYLIRSTATTKQIIEENLSQSAMYSGKVKSVGPRYCPSFEDKIVRFPSKTTHQIFLEPETKNGDTWYVQGFSTSMPIEIQEKMLRSLPGFEKVRVKYWAYAVEYDVLQPTQLKPSLEVKKVSGLFTAGQINGTSGYEEAAGQGIMAGINAALLVDHKPPFILRRDEAYLGVMIDDLVNKGVVEPYRLLTSRAEHRLLLRNDNAEQRLKSYGYQLGLIDDREYQTYQTHLALITEAIKILKSQRFGPHSPLSQRLEAKGQANLKQTYSAYELIKMPSVDIQELLLEIPFLNKLTFNQLQSLVIEARFEGYVKKERELAAKLVKLEKKQIPLDLDYDKVVNLATEARQKLKEIRPLNIGQASRITGVNPADIQMLLFYLKNRYPQEKK